MFSHDCRAVQSCNALDIATIYQQALCPWIGRIIGQHDVPVVVGVECLRHDILFEVVQTLTGFGGIPSLVQNRQQESRKDGNDCNNN